MNHPDLDQKHVDIEKEAGAGRLLSRGGRIPVPHFRITAKGKERRVLRNKARTNTKYHDLWASTLWQAVDDIRRMKDAEKCGFPMPRYNESPEALKARRKHYGWAMYDGLEALDWINGEDMGGLKFVDLCLAFDLDPEVVRKEVA